MKNKMSGYQRTETTTVYLEYHSEDDNYKAILSNDKDMKTQKTYTSIGEYKNEATVLKNAKYENPVKNEYHQWFLSVFSTLPKDRRIVLSSFWMTNMAGKKILMESEIVEKTDIDKFYRNLKGNLDHGKGYVYDSAITLAKKLKNFLDK